MLQLFVSEYFAAFLTKAIWNIASRLSQGFTLLNSGHTFYDYSHFKDRCRVILEDFEGIEFSWSLCKMTFIKGSSHAGLHVFKNGEWDPLAGERGRFYILWLIASLSCLLVSGAGGRGEGERPGTKCDPLPCVWVQEPTPVMTGHFGNLHCNRGTFIVSYTLGFLASENV